MCTPTFWEAFSVPQACLLIDSIILHYAKMSTISETCSNKPITNAVIKSSQNQMIWKMGTTIFHNHHKNDKVNHAFCFQPPLCSQCILVRKKRMLEMCWLFKQAARLGRPSSSEAKAKCFCWHVASKKKLIEATFLPLYYTRTNLHILN